MYCIAFSPCGKYLASGGDDCSLKVWSCAQQKLVAKVFTDVDVLCVQFSRDGRFLACSISFGGIKMLRTDTWRTAQNKDEFEDRFYGKQLAFSPDSRYLFYGGWNESIYIAKRTNSGWLTANVISVEFVNCWSAMCIAVSPCGRDLAFGGRDKALRIIRERTWEKLNGELTAQKIDQESHIYSVAFSNDGRFLASSCGQVVRLWRRNEHGEWVKNGVHGIVASNERVVFSVAFSPDSKLLATSNDSGEIHLWETATFKEVGRVKAHEYSLN